MIVAATGHRPHKLGGYGDDVRCRLEQLARNYLEDARPDEAVSGMALGWDQAFAQAAIDLGIPLIAVVPFDGQESRWPAESRRRYRDILCCASSIEIASDFPSSKAMQIRNEWMVDLADRMAALWDGSWGGTFNCIQYAKKRDVPVTNLWSRWDTDLSALLN